jgi:catechol 2,3-dioxygenase-like lactoylglutathione lyase family enzyme
MSKMKAPRRSPGGSSRSRAARGRSRLVSPQPPMRRPGTGDTKPRRGMKLRTVSILTMLFALLCLAAFAAGRPPVIAAGSSSVAEKEPGMFKGLRTATYQVKDLAKATAWYAHVLGVQPYFDQPFYVGFNVGGYELGLVPGEREDRARPPAGIAYWGVEDAVAAYQRLIALGATPQEPVQDVGGGIFVGSVHDPFGNVLGVIQNPNFKAKEN